MRLDNHKAACMACAINNYFNVVSNFAHRQCEFDVAPLAPLAPVKIPTSMDLTNAMVRDARSDKGTNLLVNMLKDISEKRNNPNKPIREIKNAA